MSIENKLPLPPLLNPSKGYGVGTPTIIAGLRWWDEAFEDSPRFTVGEEALSYHENHLKVIDAFRDPAPALEVYLDKSIHSLPFISVHIRYMRNDRIVEEEVYLDVSRPHPTDPNLSVIGPINLFTKDMGDGEPFYDYSMMSGAGIYEIVVRAYDSNSDYMTLRIPFGFIHLNSGGSTNNHTIEEYYFTLIEGVSPVNKLPATHYRAAGVGILRKSACGDRLLTKPPAPINNPSDEPVIGTPPSPPCAFIASPTVQNGLVGDTVSFSFAHGNDSGVISIRADFESDNIDQVSENSFAIKKIGLHQIQFTVLYGDGQECMSQVVGIEAQPPPIPSRMCGEHISGGQGYANYQFNMGSQAGKVTITYDFYGAPDTMDVYDSHGNKLATTGHVTNTQGSPIVLNYDPSMGNLVVIMNDGISGSLWEYRVGCPVP